jgi:hypothetical protein
MSGLIHRGNQMAMAEKKLPRAAQATILGCVVSLGLTVCMIVGGFASYAPSVSRTEIQNIYLSRMLLFGGTIIATQHAIIGFVIANRLRDNGSN